MDARRFTLGSLARELGEPEHRVDHVIRSRNIEPVERAGILRIFNVDALNRVRAELDAINRAHAARAGDGALS